MDITRNEVESTYHQLGVQLTLDGDDKEYCVYYLDQAKSLAGEIMASPFNRKDTEIICREQ